MRSKLLRNPVLAVIGALCAILCLAMLSEDAEAGLRQKPGCHDSQPPAVVPPAAAPVVVAPPCVPTPVAPPLVAYAPAPVTVQPPAYTFQAPPQTVEVTIPGQSLTVTPTAVAYAPAPTLAAVAPQPVLAPTAGKLTAYREAKLATRRLNRQAKTPRRSLLVAAAPVATTPQLQPYSPGCGPVPDLAAPSVLGMEE